MINFWPGLLGAFLLLGVPVQAQPLDPGILQGTIVSPSSQQKQDARSVLRRLAQAQVVYLAETHDRAADHQAQLAMIQALHRLRPNLSIALEMFQQPYQSVLDRYLAGQLSETQLQDQSQYAKRWGFPWEFYAPILRYAKANHLPVIALNLPSEITRKVARQGLDSLSSVEQQSLPPAAEIELGPDAYRDRLQQLHQEIHQGSGNSNNFDRFFLVQVLWDETMAARIARAVKQDPDRLVVVLVGQGHVAYGDGIPNRVSRRLQSQLNQPFQQFSVLLNPSPEQSQQGPAIADYVWSYP